MLLLHSSIDARLGHFLLLAIVNNDAINMGMQIALGDPAFNSLGFTSSTMITGS